MIDPVVSTWMKTVEELVEFWPENQINKTWIKVPDITLIIKGIAPVEIFDICKYQNVNLKMTQLENQYIDKESLRQARLDIHAVPAIGDCFEISLVGDAKKGSASNRKHCLQDIFLNYTQERAILNFRSSDFLKKFLTDIYFVQKKVMKLVNAENFPITCAFDNVMLRSPFWYIYLDQYGIYKGEEKLRGRIEKMDPITKSWLRFYARHKDVDINYKSLDRCRDRMEESPFWPLYSEYINRFNSI